MFRFLRGAVLVVGVARGDPTGENEEVGEGEKFTKASVEENVMCGEDALHLLDVMMFYTPIRRDLISASDIEECFRTSLGVVVYSDMGRHNSCN